MSAYACAREGLVIGLFTLRKTLFGMGSSSIVFSASEHPWKTTRHFPQNDTSFSLKRYVTFHKTTRCFMSKNRLLKNDIATIGHNGEKKQKRMMAPWRKKAEIVRSKSAQKWQYANDE